MTANDKLLIQKLFMAFVVGFGGSFLPFVLGWLNAPNYPLDKSLWIGALTGAIAAGLRGLLAISPINLVPSDAAHSIFGERKNVTITVTK